MGPTFFKCILFIYLFFFDFVLWTAVWLIHCRQDIEIDWGGGASLLQQLRAGWLLCAESAD